mmetsp:Transcript_14457/g.36596  ORF Transcript_14457/g.36596 Transcript_14457/m.36596 type:complete len:202 (-) Transcript_14457:14-619(-)
MATALSRPLPNDGSIGRLLRLAVEDLLDDVALARLGRLSVLAQQGRQVLQRHRLQLPRAVRPPGRAARLPRAAGPRAQAGPLACGIATTGVARPLALVAWVCGLLALPLASAAAVLQLQRADDHVGVILRHHLTLWRRRVVVADVHRRWTPKAGAANGLNKVPPAREVVQQGLRHICPYTACCLPPSCALVQSRRAEPGER